MSKLKDGNRWQVNRATHEDWRALYEEELDDQQPIAARQNATIMRGTVVKWWRLASAHQFRDSFGFVKPDDGSPDVFVHYSALRVNNYQPSASSGGLKVGQRVEFELSEVPIRCAAVIKPLHASQDAKAREQANARTEHRLTEELLGYGIGTVKFFRDGDGYGIITQDDGSADVFVLQSDLRRSGFESLPRGQRVEFTIVRGPKGLRAEDVTLLPAANRRAA